MTEEKMPKKMASGHADSLSGAASGLPSQRQADINNSILNSSIIIPITQQRPHVINHPAQLSVSRGLVRLPARIYVCLYRQACSSALHSIVLLHVVHACSLI